MFSQFGAGGFAQQGYGGGYSTVNDLLSLQYPSGSGGNPYQQSQFGTAQFYSQSHLQPASSGTATPITSTPSTSSTLTGLVQQPAYGAVSTATSPGFGTSMFGSSQYGGQQMPDAATLLQQQAQQQQQEFLQQIQAHNQQSQLMFGSGTGAAPTPALQPGGPGGGPAKSNAATKELTFRQPSGELIKDHFDSSMTFSKVKSQLEDNHNIKAYCHRILLPGGAPASNSQTVASANLPDDAVLFLLAPYEDEDSLLTIEVTNKWGGPVEIKVHPSQTVGEVIVLLCQALDKDPTKFRSAGLAPMYYGAAPWASWWTIQETGLVESTSNLVNFIANVNGDDSSSDEDSEGQGEPVDPVESASVKELIDEILGLPKNLLDFFHDFVSRVAPSTLPELWEEFSEEIEVDSDDDEEEEEEESDEKKQDEQASDGSGKKKKRVLTRAGAQKIVTAVLSQGPQLLDQVLETVTELFEMINDLFNLVMPNHVAKEFMKMLEEGRAACAKSYSSEQALVEDCKKFCRQFLTPDTIDALTDALWDAIDANEYITRKKFDNQFWLACGFAGIKLVKVQSRPSATRRRMAGRRGMARRFY
eukprot:TRINITY_DN67406_c4_g1_i1.p1 TRINITY_DN67406_c4_g1~~TRINITY_DN67406_c4_g1_i1.p1  ORF type:complete len:587 (+),score=70.20 TRINITY_DN67406_c4_g1_i1:35-1795(+)